MLRLLHLGGLGAGEVKSLHQLQSPAQRARNSFRLGKILLLSWNQTALFVKGSGIPNHDNVLHPHDRCTIHSWSLKEQWTGQNQT